MSLDAAVKRACHSDEALAAFVDGRLSDQERAQLVQHLATCPRCREIVSSVVSAHRDAFEPRVVPFTRRWFLPALVAATAAALLGLVVLPSLRGPNRTYASQIAGLVDAVGTSRPIEPRIVGGFAHGPSHSMRGAARAPSPQVQIAIAEIEKADTERSSEDIRHARAIAFLLEAHGDRALNILAELTARNPEDANGWSDLAAAYLVRGNPEDPVRALEAATRALQIDNRLPEALFNQALSLERQGRKADARAAWTRYLDVDSKSAWATEARDRRSRVSP